MRGSRIVPLVFFLALGVAVAQDVMKEDERKHKRPSSTKLVFGLEKGDGFKFRVSGGRKIGIDVLDRSDADALTLAVSTRPEAKTGTDSGTGSEKSVTPSPSDGKIVVLPDGSLQTDGSSPGIPDRDLMHLALILGPGLHEKELRKGQTYSLSAFGRSRSSAQPMKVRFQGLSGSDGDLARFQILAEAARPTPSAGEVEDPERNAREPESRERTALAGDARVIGSISYRVEDGLLHAVTLSEEHPGWGLRSGFSLKRVVKPS